MISRIGIAASCALAGALAARIEQDRHNSPEYVRQLTDALTRCKDLTAVFAAIEGAFTERWMAGGNFYIRGRQVTRRAP